MASSSAPQRGRASVAFGSRLKSCPQGQPTPTLSLSGPTSDYLCLCETGGTLWVLCFSSPRAASSEKRERGTRVLSTTPRSLAEQFAGEQLVVETRKHRRTALVALRGELDIVTVSKIAEVIDDLEPQAEGVRHIVLDLRGLTFMDVLGLHELIKQNEYARSNRHNLAVVRGSDEIQRVLKLTGVEDLLVLVEDPDDLVPPPLAS
jgi:anti-anti-sigma factor